jgi:hypothetical protein
MGWEDEAYTLSCIDQFTDLKSCRPHGALSAGDSSETLSWKISSTLANLESTQLTIINCKSQLIPRLRHS